MGHDMLWVLHFSVTPKRWATHCAATRHRAGQGSQSGAVGTSYAPERVKGQVKVKKREGQ
jgi:hypothetical protein